MPDEKKCPFCAEFIKAEAKICRFCNRDVQEPALPLPDVQTEATTGLMKDASPKTIVIALCLTAAVVIAWGVFGPGSKYEGASSTISASAGGGDVTDESFAKVLSGKRPGMEIVRDPERPNTVRIYFTGLLDKEKAQEVARVSRAVLGERAIVYVKDSSGETLAKAAPWGTE